MTLAILGIRSARMTSRISWKDSPRTRLEQSTAVATFGETLWTARTCFFAIVLQLVLAYTVFGRHLYGVGDNRNAARLSGLKVDRTVVITFVLTGAACGLAGLIDASTTGSGTSSTSGLGGELALLAIAGVDGFNLLAVADYWQNIVRGILIIVAVAIGFAVDRR